MHFNGFARASAVVAILMIVGCSEEKRPDSKAGSSKASETVEAGKGSGEAVKLTGSGASFPFPIYGHWFKQYCEGHKGVKIDYQAKGSGAGIKDFLNQTVDFAASDAAMKDDEISQVERGVQLLPLTAGEIVLAYNIPDGPSSLKLSREAYAKIFLAQITNWNDPIIAKANPDTKLPDLQITVVRRGEKSGTTFVLTNHLSAISEDWKSGPGTGTEVVWPGGDKFIGAKNNDGIAATVKQTPGAIGYLEYGYAKQTKIPVAELENKSGKFVGPSLESGQASLAGVELPEDLRAWLPDPAGDKAYPICSYTWLLCYKKYENPRHAELIKDVVKFCLTDGQKMSDEMGYIPLPESVVAKVLAAAENIK